MVGHLEEEHRINEIMKKHKVKFYTLVGGKSKLDTGTGSFFTDQGFHYKSKGNTTRYYAVYNDNLFQYELSKPYADEIDQAYNKATSIEKLSIEKLISLLRRKTNIKMTVMKSSLMAEQLRQNILSHFKSQ